MMAKWLAGINIGKVNFDGGDVYGLQGVMERNRGVCIAGPIDDDSGSLALRLMNPADQFALGIGLPENNLVPQRLGLGSATRFQVSDGFLAIDGGFAQAQQVQVGSV